MKTELTPQEVAKIIAEHNRIHSSKETHAIHIKQALDQAAADELKIASGEYAPVVRCGECKGWEPEKRKAHKCDICRMFGFGSNDFCSYGKRKDGEK